MASSKKNHVSAAMKPHGLSKAEKIAIPIIIIIAVWAIYSFTQSSSTTLPVKQSSTTSLSQSAGAPDFTLPIVGPNGASSQTVTLSSFRGKVVLLEFMEPWCVHCQNMASVLKSLYATYGSENVVFVSVAGPWDGATANDAASFIRTYGSSWIYAYDSSGTVFSSYGVNSTPTFFIIGKDGGIAGTYSGEQSTDTLSNAISAALSS